MTNQRDEYLWKKAQSRVAFKRHVITYILVNSGFWILFFVMRSQPWGERIHPWPIWPMLGWGIGLASHYFGAYGDGNQHKKVEDEYKKLMEGR
ncbi:2TM domain-containing protein [Persicitalea jodogahamensis]|uniref:2TM domain-containing protein n=1 Tax=Persicitalea jodogahamensis TaxID=402147 RepID=A0A8J3D6D6_9BACT|nr:2TM domain-containing protein [Persicitalea jodogahamensis]GHB80616.1 hypothetical protein GCM10007390_38760 [Persicitalea jodogahamensis]